ncbi:MAG TPA: DUF4334 domain-containing protein [Gordonia sp. (in: high G+C Gram-positive bacteria)]|uniref:DUF4334 domain-containing protein n=1 Tax=unclassified Gordonia (in: high G+C Gram-positive bacteria) TaxID=2657482 RepID=UPI000FAEE48B|nr:MULTISPECIES: DUF4334 domain-containing protein [unclassified Gordonia (in: high G+C Gram-positive bacteria)]RUP39048.1 MAG: DUF4334 domain-containing protein [Gordonia sp. (in: high G+C Gram-positive bacteria)]HNP56854.1 DUF4334 domain-containing protein [Gordonia sp. (in: high G+C Gram-positive bacteria)]HRC49816.1 DUF4334 domain-containing protein [Gordonia sp. (in: high G+C Gram-positive bacteria)]
MTTAQDLRSGLSTIAAQELFDALAPVTVDEMIGRWRGSEIPTGHPMDGLLGLTGWYGKEFIDAETVHPLLFGEPGDLYAVNPKLVPMNTLTGVASRVPRVMPPGGRAAFRGLRTRKPRARLRVISYRGASGAAMVYDDIPVIDHFRRVDDTTLLGVMDQRGADQPYFFLLEKDGPTPISPG